MKLREIAVGRVEFKKERTDGRAGGGLGGTERWEGPEKT